MNEPRTAANMLDTLSFFPDDKLTEQIEGNDNTIISDYDIIRRFAKEKRMAGFAVRAYNSLYNYYYNASLQNISLIDDILYSDVDCGNNQALQKSKNSLVVKMLLLGVSHALVTVPLNNKVVVFPLNMTSDEPMLKITDTRWQLTGGEDVYQAINKINEQFNLFYVFYVFIDNDAPFIWEPFFYTQFGWKLNVTVDESESLDKRITDSNNGETDVLGEYITEQETNKDISEYPIKTSSRIKLYKKACDDFCDELRLKYNITFDNSDVYFYVLAHELFHALQDFHVMTFYCETKKGKLGEFETQAEYFALRSVKTVLKNDDLFDALCKERVANPLKFYSDAVSSYGNIYSIASEKEFIDRFFAFEKELIDSVY
jgi:hypothetical protein